jgi:hypothetical protein
MKKVILSTKMRNSDTKNSKFEALNSKRKSNAPNYKFQTVWRIEELEFRI